jgi:hypothetical protein
MIELMVSAAVLLVVVGASVNYIGLVTQRSKAEQTKVDLTQEGREFVDEFERDIHQAGFPGCADFDTGGTTACATPGAIATATYNNPNIAVGLVSVSYTSIIFEGDVNGDGLVESVRYKLVDSAGNNPPLNCPCILQRSQVQKQNFGTAPGAYTQAVSWSQELQNVVNSGSPAANAAYGGGVPISGNVLFGGGAITNDAYYAAVTTFKDFPVFSAYDQTGTLVPLPQDNSTTAGQQALTTIKTIRLTINLLGSATSGYDTKTGVRPVVTLVGDGRRNNMMPWETP